MDHDDGVEDITSSVQNGSSRIFPSNLQDGKDTQEHSGDVSRPDSQDNDADCMDLDKPPDPRQDGTTVGQGDREANASTPIPRRDDPEPVDPTDVMYTLKPGDGGVNFVPALAHTLSKPNSWKRSGYIKTSVALDFVEGAIFKTKTQVVLKRGHGKKFANVSYSEAAKKVTIDGMTNVEKHEGQNQMLQGHPGGDTDGLTADQTSSPFPELDFDWRSKTKQNDDYRHLFVEAIENEEQQFYLVGDNAYVGSSREPYVHCGQDFFESQEEKVVGIHTPYFYISAGKNAVTNLHVEDGWLPSVNVVHYGAPKIWLIVEPAHRQALENKIKEMLGLKKTNCDQFVRHEELFLSPDLLDEWDIHYSIVPCAAGELIFVAPEAYHQVINAGANFAEAINLILPDEQGAPDQYRICRPSCSGGKHNPVRLDQLRILKKRSARRGRSAGDPTTTPSPDTTKQPGAKPDGKKRSNSVTSAGKPPKKPKGNGDGKKPRRNATEPSAETVLSNFQEVSSITLQKPAGKEPAKQRPAASLKHRAPQPTAAMDAGESATKRFREQYERNALADRRSLEARLKKCFHRARLHKAYLDAAQAVDAQRGKEGDIARTRGGGSHVRHHAKKELFEDVKRELGDKAPRRKSFDATMEEASKCYKIEQACGGWAIWVFLQLALRWHSSPMLEENVRWTLNQINRNNGALEKKLQALLATGERAQFKEGIAAISRGNGKGAEDADDCAQSLLETAPSTSQTDMGLFSFLEDVSGTSNTGAIGETE
ncbi:Lysine-specific demethylase 4D [Lasiodiplodia theobromae]|uniref:Lysine-specific demethylase 4D n=1 Tax=Lasiodiplodia theobromae TaxID=45133 RepID=A0A5N5CWM1_9PEZI|nr:Lysine-specific demethylase 4D [Lasiodiplodia theobromae]